METQNTKTLTNAYFNKKKKISDIDVEIFEYFI